MLNDTIEYLGYNANCSIVLTKCGDLNYRFTQDKFENHVEHYSCNQRGLDNSHLLLLFIFVIFIALIISNKKSCYNIGVFNKHHKLKNN